MECRLLSLKPGRLPWPSLEVRISAKARSVVSGVKSLDWPWILLSASLRVGVLRGDRQIDLGSFPLTRPSNVSRLEFTADLGYDGLAVIENARQSGDVEFRMYAYFSVAWFSPDEEGQHFVAVQDKSGTVIQEEDKETVRIPVSDWETTYLPSWGQMAPLIISIGDPVLIEALMAEAEKLDMTPQVLAQEILRRRVAEREE